MDVSEGVNLGAVGSMLIGRYCCGSVVMVMVKMMVVEDHSASSFKGGRVFLSFRKAQVESSVVFEETTWKLQGRHSNLRLGADQDQVVSWVCRM